jgi:hypothetical protein
MALNACQGNRECTQCQRLSKQEIGCITQDWIDAIVDLGAYLHHTARVSR